MKAVYITKNNLERCKAIKIIRAVCLFIAIVFSVFPVNASDAKSVEQKQSLSLEETQGYVAAASTNQGYYAFRSRPESRSFRSHFSSNNSVVFNTIVNIMKENIVLSRTTLGVNFVWKW